MHRFFAITVLAVASLAVNQAVQQVPAEQASFDVVSIRRNTSGSMAGPGARSVGSQPGGRFMMVDGTVHVLLRSAYPGITDIIGGPAWMLEERYDVETRAAGNPDAEQMAVMLRAMLADRLQLAGRLESREQETYALMVARPDGRLGPELRRYDADCEAFIAAARSGGARPELPATGNDSPGCGYRIGGRRLVAGGIALATLARSIEGLAGRPIVDKTGLSGNFAFTLDWNGDLSVFTALEEQLGLRLEPQRNPLQVFVIERLERPNPN